MSFMRNQSITGAMREHNARQENVKGGLGWYAR